MVAQSCLPLFCKVFIFLHLFFSSSWDDWGPSNNTNSSNSSSRNKASSKRDQQSVKGLDEDLDNPWDDSAWDAVEQEYQMKMSLK